MSFNQALIPIVRERTHTVVGAIQIRITDFDGTETEVPTLASPEDPEDPAYVAISIEKYFSGVPRGGRSPWYMAWVLNEEDFRSNKWKHYTNFLDTNNFNATAFFQSTTTDASKVTELPSALTPII